MSSTLCFFLKITIYISAFSIHDPPLDRQFDEIEGYKFENESLEIDRKIRELELEFKPEFLPVLTFQKPLNNFTWLCLGRSVVHMHSYLIEQKTVRSKVYFSLIFFSLCLVVYIIDNFISHLFTSFWFCVVFNKIYVF